MAEDAPAFEHQEDVERWLKSRPRDDAVVIAARAALRAVPGLLAATKTDDTKRDLALISTIFRAMAAPWAVAKCPAQGAGIRAAAASASASSSAAARASDAFAAATAAVYASASSSAAARGYTAAYAASRAAYASAAASASAYFAAARASDAALDVEAALEAEAAARAASAAATAADAAALSGGAAPDGLAGAALWPDGMPNHLERAWRELKAWLLAREGENWRVWADWYEARLAGGTVNCALEVARVTELTEEDWADPVRANAKLAQIESRFATAGDVGDAGEPERGVAPYRFNLDAGRLDAQPLAGAASNQSLLDQLRDDLAAQAGRYRDQMARSNAPHRVQSTAARIADLLDGWDAAPHAAKLWRAGNDLLGDREEYAPPDRRDELPDGALAEMDSLARSLEGFLALFPDIRELRLAVEASRLSPEQIETVQAGADGAAAEYEAVPDLVSPAAVEAVRDASAEVAEALQDAAASSDLVARNRAMARAADRAAERVLVSGDMLHELVEAAERWADDQEDLQQDAAQLGLGAGQTPHEEFKALATAGLRTWVLDRQRELLDTGWGVAVVLIALILPPLGLLVALPYVSRYLPALNSVLRLLEAWRRRGEDRSKPDDEDE